MSFRFIKPSGINYHEKLYNIFENFRCVTSLSSLEDIQKQNATSTNTTVSAEDIAIDEMMKDPGPVCKPIDEANIRQGESAAEQYWERFVLGIHKSKLGEQLITFDNDRYM